jgi:hypothetical protein
LAVELVLKALVGKYFLEDGLEEVTFSGVKFRVGRSKQYVVRDKGHFLDEVRVCHL